MTDDGHHDRRAWASSLLIAATTGALLLLYAVFWPQLVHGRDVWVYSLDWWQTVDGGRFVADGALPYVYQGTGAYALPLGFVAMAPAAWLADHLRLLPGAPYAVPRPTSILVIFPWADLWGIFLLYSVRRLAWDLGARSRLLVLQLLAAAVVLVPCFYWGHPEDVLALTFVFYAVRRMLAGSWVPAAFLLSLAIASKQWALLLLPFVLAAAPRDQWRRVLVAACAVPGFFVVLTLGLDWKDAFPALFQPVNMGTNTPGHLSFYATWLGSRTSEYSRTLGVVASLPAGWMLRRWRGAPWMLVACGLLLLIRPFAEAISYSYYWGPGVMMAGLVGVAVHRRVRWQDWALPVLAIVWAMPKGHASTTTLWWLGEIPILALIAAQVAVNLGISLRRKFAVRQTVKVGDRPPILTSVPTAAGDASWIQ